MIAECAGYNEAREQAMQEIIRVWGQEGTDRWEWMEQREQVAELLGILKGGRKWALDHSETNVVQIWVK